MMKHFLLSHLFTLIFINMCFAQVDCVNNRYLEKCFPASVKSHSNLVYSVAPEISTVYVNEATTVNTSLKLDVYEPLGDTLSRRPVIVFGHGGGFISGSKENDDVIAFCDSFAQRGYVTIGFNYRIGLNTAVASTTTRAMYRGLQDSRALLRYIRANAALLKIDTNNIFLGGSSAGAFISHMNAFMNKESERPASTFSAFLQPDLGCLDCTGSFTNMNARAKAIVPLWGAMLDTNLIEAGDNTPVLMVHGTIDPVVPNGSGYPFLLLTVPMVHGSSIIHQRLSNVGMQNEFYPFAGQVHEPHGVLNGAWLPPGPTAFWDTVLDVTTTFLYKQMKPAADFTFNVNQNTVAFTNQSQGAVSWCWNFGDGNTSVFQNPNHTYDSTGWYTATLTSQNGVTAFDTISKLVYISDITGMPAAEYKLLPVSPNPAADELYVPAPTQYVQVMDCSGRILISERMTSNKLSVRELVEGIYFLRTEQGVMRFVVAR